MEEIQMCIDEAQSSMKSAIEHVKNELSKVRAGKVLPTFLNGIRVDYYGTPSSVDKIASITSGDARTLIVKPWEKNFINAIAVAIQDANLGVNPIKEADIVRVVFPSLTEERRKQLVKQVKGEGENGKIRLRSVRKDVNDMLKQLQKEGTPEDAVKAAEKKIQDMVDSFSSQIDDLLKSKEAEIMTV